MATMQLVVTGRLAELPTQDRADYLGHILAVPLSSIRNDAQLEEAIAKIDELLDRPQLSRGDSLYLDALSDLVAHYESEHVVFPQARAVEIVRHLMEANELQQKDLVEVFGTKSTVSEVLRGKRPLALSHIAKLSDYFGVPADLFIDRPGTAPGGDESAVRRA